MSTTPLGPRHLGRSYGVVIHQLAPGTTVLAAAVSGLRHYVIGGMVTIDAAGTMDLLSASSSLCGAPSIVLGSGWVWPTSPCQYTETEPGEALSIVTTVGNAKGFLRIVTEA